MTEIWRDIGGYEGYQVSNLGRIKSFKRGREQIKKLRPNGAGYLRVWLRGKEPFVHRLVAEAFVDNPESKPQINHINGIKTDNRVENLEWVTDTENKRHAFATGLQRQGEDRPDAKLTAAQVVYIRENPDSLSIKQLAHMFGVTPTTISYIQRGKIYKAAGGVIHKSKRPRVPDEVRAEIRRLYVRGSHEFGCYVLARKYGLGVTTVKQIIHEN